MRKCTLTTPNDFFLQLRYQQIGSLSPTRDKSGHVRSQAMVQNHTRICAQSKLRSNWCLAKNKVERIYSCFVLKLNVCLLQSQHQSSSSWSLTYRRRKKECLHPWVRVDQAGSPLPPKTLSILVGLTLKLVSLCIIISVVENIWTLCFILEYFCLIAWKYTFDRCQPKWEDIVESMAEKAPNWRSLVSDEVCLERLVP